MNLLRKPYPFDNDILKNLYQSIFFSIFIFTFLTIFQPFGINEIDKKDLLSFTSGFGIITFIYLILHFIILDKLSIPEKWTVGKEILSIVTTLLMIGLFNYFYDHIYFSDSIEISGIIQFELYTFSVGIIPISIFIIVNQNWLLKKYLNEANEINRKKNIKDLENPISGVVTISASNPKSKIKFRNDQIIFIAGCDNYIDINYMSEGKNKNKIVRTTLKKAEEELLNFNEFYRCHKSYIVNISKIAQVQGNAQGLRLQLENSDKIIPVSRQLHREFKKKFSIS
ncbi:MAG: LytTR family DNA-binding domain-containing protein [Calditrichaceae bacterium]